MNPRLKTLVLACCVFACKEAAVASEPPARIERRTNDDDLASITLRPDAEAALGLVTAPITSVGAAPRIRVGGEVMVADGRDVIIAAPIGGRIVTTKVPRPGDRVRPGQALLTIVPLAAVDRDIRARAERDLAAARAELTLVLQRARRAELMVEERSASVRSLEEARAQVAVAQATVAQSESRLATMDSGALDADIALTIKSPSEGALRAVRVTTGQSVPAGAALFELAGAGRWVRATLAASDAVRFAALSSATATRMGDGPSVELTTMEGPPSADPLRGTVDRYFVMPHDADWVPGERVIVELVAGAGGDEALAVPRSAVVYDATGAAWVYEKTAANKLRRRRVDVERRDGEQLLIRKPSRALADIVTTGAAELWGFELGADR